MTAWVDAGLEAAGRRRIGELEVIHERPWSTVVRVPTTDGAAFLKQCGLPVRFEAALYELLAERVPERIVVPLAVDAERGWVLLPDGGPAGELGVVPTLEAYADLQQALDPDELVARGVADMRPEVMPERFDEALEAAARTATPAGREALAGLEGLAGAFVDDCERLAAAPGGASLDHNDLHPGNVLRGGRFYDWGDAVVAHSFACLYVPLGMLEDGPPEARAAARDAYLRRWADLGPPEALAPVAELAVHVAVPARALVWARALAPAAPGDPHLERFADAAALTLARLAGRPPA